MALPVSDLLRPLGACSPSCDFAVRHPPACVKRNPGASLWTDEHGDTEKEQDLTAKMIRRLDVPSYCCRYLVAYLGIFSCENVDDPIRYPIYVFST